MKKKIVGLAIPCVIACAALPGRKDSAYLGAAQKSAAGRLK